jgi:putative heme-binding domain-containing protein
MDAAVWRYDTQSRKFGIFAEGTSNPWGLDFNPDGQAFLTACVIPHAYHMIPGGTYIRQGGSSKNPYAYGLLNEISDHTHHAESGWAHAGALVLQGSSIPAPYRGSLLMGSIHGNSIKRDELGRRGSTYVARHAPDFLVSGDKNFRPVNLRWGPDGTIYVIDWCDQNPCHQAKPTSWDMTHGRIYKIQRKGQKTGPAPDLAKLSTAELAAALQSDDPWRHRTALRLLRERQDPSILASLFQVVTGQHEDPVRLRALWAFYTNGGLHEDAAKQLLRSPSAWVRAWTVQLLGEQPELANKCSQELVELADKEKSLDVRLALACAARHFRKAEALGCVHSLMKHAADLKDPCLPLMIWLATEPLVGQYTEELLGWMAHTGEQNALVSDYIWPRALRRALADRSPARIALCLSLVRASKSPRVRLEGLTGILEGLGERQTELPGNAAADLAALESDADPAARRLALRLAVRFRIRQAIEAALKTAGDAKLPVSTRLDSLHDLAAVRPPEALTELERMLQKESSDPIRIEVLRALTGYSDPGIARQVIAAWKSFSPAVRVEAVNLLASRRPWARPLLDAVRDKVIGQGEINNNIILRLGRFRDAALNGEIEKVWGKMRQGTPAELDALIERKRGELAGGPGSMTRGKQVFANQCAKCHKFQGQGSDVGPALDGAARDIDYLLANVFDPNRVVGQPYFQNYVVLNNGRIENGLRVGEDANSITLKSENNAVKTIARKDIQELTVQQKSLMPEGLEKILTAQELRDLFRYVMANPFLIHVSIAGPLSPLETSSLDPARPTTMAGLRWGEARVGVTGGVPLPAPESTGDAVAYLSADFEAKAPVKSQLLLGGSVGLQVWLDGRQIYDGRPSQRPAAPDQAGIPVEMSAGKHRLIVRAGYRGAKEAVFLRFADPGRQLGYGD